ncbi:hypothetical protein HAX54_048355 [Datura stramonium]|uniref:Uncharacterized protein n=1 Tax=Datura stramonium TaxID=4076 RepID=A0ABS8WJ94_DATST|nr:hypothetical protein [Datura stramonium]
MLSHLYGMQMLQLRMNGVTEAQPQQLNIDYPLSEHSRALCRVGPGYKEPLDDDVSVEDEMARVDSYIEREAPVFLGDGWHAVTVILRDGKHATSLFPAREGM